MLKPIFAAFGAAILAMSIAAPSFAAPDPAGQPIEAKLDAYIVTLDAEGNEVLEAADAARPGDLLEYRAGYHNASEAGVAGFSPVLPVPAGMEFVDGDQSAVALLASLDGKHFAPVPLTREVLLDDGTVEQQAVPLSEYRCLKWLPTDLGAGAHLQVSARMRVSR